MPLLSGMPLVHVPRSSIEQRAVTECVVRDAAGLLADVRGYLHRRDQAPVPPFDKSSEKETFTIVVPMYPWRCLSCKSWELYKSNESESFRSPESPRQGWNRSEAILSYL